MYAFTLHDEQEFDPKRHVEKILGRAAEGDFTVACWEPGQVSPNHCHPDATENFSASWLSHYSPERSKWTYVWLATWAYRILIPGVVGGMLLYAILLSARRRRPVQVVEG